MSNGRGFTNAGPGSNQYVSRSAVARSRDEIEVSLVAAAFASDNGLAEWEAWGATDEEIVDWTETVGVSACEAAWCTAYGITPRDAVCYKQAGLRFGDHETVGWARPAYEPWFHRGGVPAEEVGEWRAALQHTNIFGVTVAESAFLHWGLPAARFRDAGWSPDDAAPWIKAGYFSPEEVPGSAAEQVRLLGEWNAARDALEQRWRSSGLRPCQHGNRTGRGEGVMVFRAWGMTDPQETRRWFKDIRDKTFATYWHRVGIPYEYAAQGYKAWSQCQVGFSDPRLIESWWRAEKHPRDEAVRVRGAIESGKWDRVHHVDGWITEGTDPGTARTWSATTSEHPREVTRWIAAGWDPDGFNEWHNVCAPFGVRFQSEMDHSFKPVAYLIRDRGGSPADAATVLQALENHVGI